MILKYDQRYQSIEIDSIKKQRKLKTIKNSIKQHQDFHFSTIPAYWVLKEMIENRFDENYNNSWLLGYRDITGVNNERTFVSTIIPRTAAGHTIPIIISFYHINSQFPSPTFATTLFHSKPHILIILIL